MLIWVSNNKSFTTPRNIYLSSNKKETVFLHDYRQVIIYIFLLVGVNVGRTDKWIAGSVDGFSTGFNDGVAEGFVDGITKK